MVALLFRYPPASAPLFPRCNCGCFLRAGYKDCCRARSKASLVWTWRFSLATTCQHLSTCPLSLRGYGLNDSPVGLLAWFLEKFQSWSDCEHGRPEDSGISMDEILRLPTKMFDFTFSVFFFYSLNVSLLSWNVLGRFLDCIVELLFRFSLRVLVIIVWLRRMTFLLPRVKKRGAGSPRRLALGSQ